MSEHKTVIFKHIYITHSFKNYQIFETSIDRGLYFSISLETYKAILWVIFNMWREETAHYVEIPCFKGHDLTVKFLLYFILVVFYISYFRNTR